MKRIFNVTLATAVAAALTFLATTTSRHGVRTVHAQTGCSNATLTGNYPFTYTGHSTMGQSNVPNAAVGVFTFDGAGNLSESYTFVLNGVAKTTSAPHKGTYTVNSDCTGTATDATVGIHFNLVTVGGGSEVFGVQTDPGFTDTFDAKKQ